MGETRSSAMAYDAWFDAPWGRYAFAVESRGLLTPLGPLSGKTVLDAGCGTGRFTEILVRSGAIVLGLDRDPSMLGVARAKVGARLLLGDAACLPFADETFDVSMAVTLCEFAAHPDRVVAELARVTKRGGHAVIGALNRASPWGVAHRRRFRRPPWDTARFFTWSELLALGAPHGRTHITSALYAAGNQPGLGFAGPVMESLGRLAPRLGAFRVVVVEIDKRDFRHAE